MLIIITFEPYHIAVQTVCRTRTGFGKAIDGSPAVISEDNRCADKAADQDNCGQYRGKEQGDRTDSSCSQCRLIVKVPGRLPRRNRYNWYRSFVLHGIQMSKGQHKTNIHKLNLNLERHKANMITFA